MTGTTKQQFKELLACPCMRLRQTSRAVSRLYDHALESVELTSPQFALLVHVVARAGRRMQELADELVMDPTTLKRLLDPMVRRGLVEVRTAEADARAREVFATPQGASLFEAAVPHWRQATRTINAQLGKAKVASLAQTLTDALGQLKEAASDAP
jgi:DNA-binding MarR family transcriptional regulator